MRISVTAVAVVSLLAVLGCAERYVVPSQNLMRGDLVENCYVRTADGYEYHFGRAVVNGDQLIGNVVEEVEEVGEDGEVFVRSETRQVQLPISTVVQVEAVKHQVSANTVYVAGAVGVGALIYAALSGDDITDARARSSGVGTKPIP